LSTTRGRGLPARAGKYYIQAHVVHQEIEPLTHEEVPLFLGSVLQNDTDYYPLFLCAIHTALRSGELVGLQWGDIDLHGKFLTVRRSVVRRKLDSPKYGKTRFALKPQPRRTRRRLGIRRRICLGCGTCRR
jgi:integrase